MLDILFSGQLLAAALVSASVYALVSLGLNLVYGTMRLLNVAHGDIAMLGGYVAYWSLTALGVTPLWSLSCTGALAGVVGVLAYRHLFWHVLNASPDAVRSESNSLLVFFGVSVIVQNTIALGFTATARGYQYLGDVIHIGNAAITGNRLATLVVSAVLCLAACLSGCYFVISTSANISIRCC